jgi:hypothetical protein
MRPLTKGVARTPPEVVEGSLLDDDGVEVSYFGLTSLIGSGVE